MAAVLSLALVAGAPWQLVAAAALAMLHPVGFLVMAAAWAAARRPRRGPGHAEEAVFLRGYAAELAAGASLRGGLEAAAARAPGLRLERAVRLCRAGRPAGEIGAALGEALPVHGGAAAAAFGMAARNGGPMGRMVETLAARAESEARLAAERAALTAQARLSAWIVGGGPVALLGLGMATGRLPGASEGGPAALALAGVGTALIGAGAAVVWVMVRRAGR